jgi:N-acetylglucosamine kinase-like BadF-type ATPase
LEQLRDHLDLAADLDLVDVVLNRWGGDRSRVAGLSRVVVSAASAGDPTCAQILDGAGRVLAELVEATRVRLGFTDAETVPVSYSGGVFSSAAVCDAFTRALEECPAQYDLRTPLLPPAIGAAVYAAKLAGSPLDDPSLANLRNHAGSTLMNGATAHAEE